jgi:hypothetical protein
MIIFVPKVAILPNIPDHGKNIKLAKARKDGT